jgi:hypothetical protein
MFGDVSLVAVYVAVLLLLTAASTHRMAGAVLGIGGNSKQEAMYPVYAIDAAGQKLDGANRYTVRFAPGQLPPVNAFWSLTMYDLPASLLESRTGCPRPKVPSSLPCVSTGQSKQRSTARGSSRR